MTDTTHYKEQLQASLEAVTADLNTIAVYDDQTGDWVAKPEGTEVGEADPNVEADIVEDWNERRATLSQLETRYNNLKRALQKIEDGSFGTCEVSGEPIEPERLNANPAARTCSKHMDQEVNLPLH